MPAGTEQVIGSWGRVTRLPHHAITLTDRHQPLPLAPGRTVLAFGNGRSYGDSNLNPGGTLLLTRALDRFIQFDPATGVLRCEAGVLLSAILQLALPQGWFLPVTPGTQFVTVGGAIANDVHGKNHHLAGCFGHHVTRLELLRSDGGRYLCSPQSHPALFSATIGGLGLTGLITWAEIQLRRVANAWLDAETLKFHRLEEFFELSSESERDHEYTVAWIDCASTGRALGRGLFSRAKHASAAIDPKLPLDAHAPFATPVRRVPLTPPFSLVNRWSLKAFNAAYFHRQRAPSVRRLQHARTFFYPLDGLLEWNRLYGPRGFFQYQCVLPPEQELPATRQLLKTISASGTGSFLAVLKRFGALPPRGMLSFPQQGTTLALDFPNQGERLHRLFAELDRIVMAAGGRLYPAKDGRMSAAAFQAGYPRWAEFIDHVDPRFSSALWRRVMENPCARS